MIVRDGTDTFKEDDDEREWTGGTWSFAANGDETLVPAYLVLKAGDRHVVYDIAGLTGGSWLTDDLGDKGISHISFYDTDGGVNGNIPVPAGLPLILTGLGALGVMRLGKRKS